jgi:hypothetical protein
MSLRSILSLLTLTVAATATPVVASASASTIEDAPPITSGFSWTYGQDPVPMGPASGRVCFLTKVAGAFNGPEDFVRAYVQLGSWFLHGQKAHGSPFLSAGAHCIASQSYSNVYTWAQGQPPTVMEPASSHSCFLVRVMGDFGDPSDFVHAQVHNGMWRLTGASAGQGVEAWARCIPRPATIEYSWATGQVPTVMKPVSTHHCFLTRVQGQLDTEQELVRTRQVVNGAWRLDGAAGPNREVRARARCVVTATLEG